MEEFSTTVNIHDVSPDAMWAVISMWSGEYVALAGFGAAVVQADEGKPGAMRTLTFAGAQFQEQLDTLDAANKTFSYHFFGAVPFPVEGYKASVTVTPADKGCNVLWRGECKFTCDHKDRPNFPM